MSGDPVNSGDDGRSRYPEEKPLAVRRADGAEPWPGYHDDLEMQIALVDAIIGVPGRPVADVGDLADLMGALPGDMNVRLDPVVWAAGHPRDDLAGQSLRSDVFAILNEHAELSVDAGQPIGASHSTADLFKPHPAS